MGSARRPLVALILLLATAGGCREETATPEAKTAGLRIVSLSPAISRCLADLGLGGEVVGRSAFCDSVPASLPVVGDHLTVDYERLVRLRPTHVLVQPPAAGPDPALVTLGETHGWTVGQWHLDGLADIEAMVRAMPGLIHPEAGAAQASLDAKAKSLADGLARWRERGPNDPPARWAGRTLLVCGTEPVLVFGRETYLNDMLETLGGTNAVSSRGWVPLSLEDVARLDPEAMVLVATDGGTDFAQRGGALAELDVSAVRSGRLAVLVDPEAMRPSTGLIGVGETLRIVLDGFDGASP